ncbi:XkdX family protein [Bacillus mycoides]|uniref:XkdX family protein n=1 Tax=Bacillus mycoides TaxID=1405 RepID=UPI001C02BB4D|nr:XkdX family protein [Bacillus mycoides]
MAVVLMFTTDAEKWKYFYDMNWATKEQIAGLTWKGRLTEQDYLDIVGESYKGYPI